MRVHGLALIALFACGARTELADGAGVVSSCPAVATGAPCTAWKAGAANIVATGSTLGGAVRSACGVLVASYSSTWSTIDVGFDGAPRAAAISHPHLAGATSTATISLATDGVQIGALESDETGCRFARLDEDGRDLGSTTNCGPGFCVGANATNGMFSFVQAHAYDATTPLTLAVVGKDDELTQTTLDMPSPQVLVDRLTFDDGSFLVSTYLPDPSTLTTAIDWVSPFDIGGNALGPRAVVTGFDGVRVRLVAAGQGALELWAENGLMVAPIDRNGNPTAPPNPIDPNGTTVTMAPMPNGDALLVWITFSANNTYPLLAATVAPDGTLRASATVILSDAEAAFDTNTFAVVDASGSRALLVTTQADGSVETIPLTCMQ